MQKNYHSLLSAWATRSFHRRPINRLEDCQVGVKPGFIYRSEGFPRTGYFVPGRDGTGARCPEKVLRRRRVTLARARVPARTSY